MKLILDADIPRSFLSKLKGQGYDAVDVRDLSGIPMPDEEIFKLAIKEKRVLITRDLDFSNILHYPPKKSYGIIVLRTHLLPKEEIFEILLKALQISEEQIKGTLVIAGGETDGRWLAEVRELGGMSVVGGDRLEAFRRAEALALRALAARLETNTPIHGAPAELALRFNLV